MLPQDVFSIAQQGYAALMRFLRQLYLRNCKKGEILSKEVCGQIFEDIGIHDDELTREEFIPGSSGISALYRRLMQEADWEEVK